MRVAAARGEAAGHEGKLYTRGTENRERAKKYGLGAREVEGNSLMMASNRGTEHFLKGEKKVRKRGYGTSPHKGKEKVERARNMGLAAGGEGISPLGSNEFKKWGRYSVRGRKQRSEEEEGLDRLNFAQKRAYFSLPRWLEKNRGGTAMESSGGEKKGSFLHPRKKKKGPQAN